MYINACISSSDKWYSKLAQLNSCQSYNWQHTKSFICNHLFRRICFDCRLQFCTIQIARRYSVWLTAICSWLWELMKKQKFQIIVMVNAHSQKLFKNVSTGRSPNGPLRYGQNFEKKLKRKFHYHSIKEHPKISKITKFGCEML